MTAEEFHDALHVEVGRPRHETRTIQSGRITQRVVVHEPGTHRADWAAATIQLATHAIKLRVKLNLQKNDLSQADFVRLSNLVLRGIRTYWSRPTRIKNETFSIDVNAIVSSADAVGVE